MSRRTRTWTVLAAALTLAATTVLPAQAVEPSPAAGPSTAHDVSVRWTGKAGFLRLEGDALGTVTVVPGDVGEVTLRVRNDGPSDGSLTVTVTNPAFLGAGTDDEFFRDLRINDILAAGLANGDHVFHSVEIAQGATVEVPLRYEFSSEATSGNRALGGERELTFDVELRITGDTPDTPSASTVPAPAPGGPDRVQPAEASDGDEWSGSTALTGGAALAPRTWMLILAAGLVTVAIAAARVRLRNAAAQEDE